MELRKKSEIKPRRIKVMTSVVVERDNPERCHYTCPYVDDFYGYPECNLYHTPLGFIKDKQIVFRCKKCLMKDRVNEVLIRNVKKIGKIIETGNYREALKRIKSLGKRLEEGKEY